MTLLRPVALVMIVFTMKKPPSTSKLFFTIIICRWLDLYFRPIVVEPVAYHIRKNAGKEWFG
mgnify:CR=1 FL=1